MRLVRLPMKSFSAEAQELKMLEFGTKIGEGILFVLPAQPPDGGVSSYC